MAGKKTIRIEKRVDTFTYHQIQIAKRTLRMSDVGAMIMGGMNKAEARAVLRKAGYSPQYIRGLER